MEGQGCYIESRSGERYVDYAITEEADLTDWRSSLRANGELKRDVEREVLERGVLVFPGSKKYVSLAHDDEAFETTKEAYTTAIEGVTPN